ncbi:MAG: M48 family metallopeptidase [Pseudomonadota bacterium]
MIARGMDALHARKAALILRDALADWQAGRLSRLRAGHWAASALALAILAVPPILLIGAAILAIAGWPSISVMVIAALLALMGAVLLPRRPRLPDRLLRADDMPETFALLDALADAMQAPRITALTIEEDANAHVAQMRGEVLLGIGAILWSAATPEARRAILAHEMGHLVNGDPRRGGAIWQAREVLARWHDLIAPHGSGGESLASEVIQLPATLAIEVLDAALLRLTYPESQRAEYLADALAAQTAGSRAMISAMKLLSHSPLLDARFNRLYGPSAPQGAACVAWIADAIVDPSSDDAQRIAADMAAELHTVDASHPPTGHRIAFLHALDLPPSDLPMAGGPALEVEWAPHLDRIGDRWRRAAMVQ